MITAECLWTIHRAAFGGKSAVTGAALPKELADCPPGVQGSHYAMAFFVARMTETPDPPTPPAVLPDEAERLRMVVLRELGAALAELRMPEPLEE